MAHVFLSYSHQDEDYAVKLEEAMQSHGLDVWRDSRIDYGTRWPDVIEEHLDQSAAVVPVMTENAKASERVQNELTQAKRKSIPVLPVLLSGEAWLALEATQYVNVTGGTPSRPTTSTPGYGRFSGVVGLPRRNPLQRSLRVPHP